MKRNYFILLVGFIFCLTANAKDLENKSTYIGKNLKNPANKFISCVGELGIKAGFGNKLSPIAYLFGGTLGHDPHPAVAYFEILTKDTNRLLAIYEVFLTSTDPQKGWQYQQSGNEISQFSTRVSPIASLVDRVSKTEITKFNISSCD